MSNSFSVTSTCFASSFAASSSALGMEIWPLNDVFFGNTLAFPLIKEIKMLPSEVSVLRYMTWHIARSDASAKANSCCFVGCPRPGG